MKWYEKLVEDHTHLAGVVDLLVIPPTVDEVVAEYPEITAEGDLLNAAYQLVVHDGQGRGLTRLALYVSSRRKGNTHKFATAMALQKIWGTKTTDTFWAGRKPFYEVYGESYADDVRKKLAKRGVSLGPQQEYFPELARFRGDPEAVISFDGARSRIKSLCEKRGMACEGAVNVDHREPGIDPHDPYNHRPLGEDIIRRNIAKMVKDDPSLKGKSRAEMREAVIAKHGPSK